MTKIKCLSILLVFDANLPKLEGCFFFKDRFCTGAALSQESLRTQAQEISGDQHCVAVRNSTEALSDATSTVMGFFLEKSLNLSHGLDVNEIKQLRFITFVEQNKLVMLEPHS